MTEVKSMTVRQEEDGTVRILEWYNEEVFSMSLLNGESKYGIGFSPFLAMSQGRIYVTAINGRWIYRPVGWETHNRDGVRCVLESFELFA